MTVCGIRQFQGVSREDAEMILKAAKEMEKIWTSTDADGSVFDAACRPILKIMCREISVNFYAVSTQFNVQILIDHNLHIK